MRKILYFAISVVAICLMVIALFLFLSQTGTTNPVYPATTAGEQPVILSGVPDVHQAEYYSCGASSFQAVMRYYGLESFETTLRQRLNTTPVHGTYPWDMVRVAKELGFEAEWRENLTLADLETSIREKAPVIIDGQRIKGQSLSWEETWNAGHYMVVIGIDDNYVYLEDPAILGSRLKITRDEFLSLWHDYESELPVPKDAHKYYRLGVFIRGTPHPVQNDYVNMTTVLPEIPPASA